MWTFPTRKNYFPRDRAREHHSGASGRMRARLIGAVGTLFLVGFVAGCATAPEPVREEPADRWVHEIRERSRRDGPEERTGTLFYRRSVVTPYFSTVVIGKTRYSYIYPTDDDPFRGYRADPAPVPIETDKELEAVEGRSRRRGYYLAELEERRPNTPNDWVWVERGNIRAWVRPGMLEDLADRYALYPIDPEPRAPVRMRIEFRGTFGVRR